MCSHQGFEKYTFRPCSRPWIQESRRKLIYNNPKISIYKNQYLTKQMTEKPANQINQLLDPEYCPYQTKRDRKKLKRQILQFRQKKIVSNTWKWSENQNTKYYKFISKNDSIFTTNDKCQKHRIFSKMALFLKSRNATQCRTHHQKMLNKYGTIQTIINISNKIVVQLNQSQKINSLTTTNQKKIEVQNFSTNELIFNTDNQCFEQLFQPKFIRANTSIKQDVQMVYDQDPFYQTLFNVLTLDIPNKIK